MSISNETSSKRIFQNDEVVENNGVYFYRFDMTPINGVINGLIISGGYVNGKIECRNGKFHGEVLTFFDNGIDTLIHYPKALPFIDIFKQNIENLGDFEKSFINQTEILSLPIYPELNDNELNYIISKIKEFFFHDE